MKTISLVFALQCISLLIFLLDFNHVFVSCDGTGIMFEILKQMLAQAPVKILSLFQIGLLARLMSQRRRLPPTGFDGIDNDRDGRVDEEDEWALDSNKKNVMIFMGKHNIQVSNHGIQKEELIEEECDEEECDQNIDGEDDEIEDDNSSDEQEYQGDKDKKNKYKDKNKISKNGYQKDSEEIKKETKNETKKEIKKVIKKDKYNKKKIIKDQKKTNSKKKNMKTSYAEDNTIDGPEYGPTFLSSVNSKTTQKLFPWLKSFELNDGKNTYSLKEFKDSNGIMALPNGFPIGGSKLEDFNFDNIRRNDNSFKKNSLTFESLDSEINELLSHPEVIEFLYKLNQSLATNESQIDEIKRTKRQVKAYNSDNFSAKVSKQNKYSIHHSLNYDLKTKNFSNLSQNHSKNAYSSHSKPMDDKKSIDRSSTDLKSKRKLKSMKSKNAIKSTKTYKLGKNISFKPLNTKYKTSSTDYRPEYQNLETTDDDEYEEPLNEGSNYGSHVNQEYNNNDSQYGMDLPQLPQPINQFVSYPDFNGFSDGKSPEIPIMDLTHWNNLIKKVNNNKKYTTTEKSTQYNKDDLDEEVEEEDDDEEQEEDQEFEEERPKKVHKTIQIIKSGTKMGNIGINSDEERSPRVWIRRIPSFRSFFSRN